MIIPVILAGGAGTRLWPLSRECFPKQLLPLTSNRTMLQNTLARVRDSSHFGPPLIICNHNHRFMVAEQIRELGLTEVTIIIEPAGRNTAPAAAIAALELLEIADATMLLLPADHVITEEDRFRDAVCMAEQYARQGRLVAFGIEPRLPEVEYGYIKKGTRLNRNGSDPPCHTIATFIEKPQLDLAESLVESGDYLWNAGIYLCTAASYLTELGLYAPEALAMANESHSNKSRDLDFVRLPDEPFSTIQGQSIDYAILERTENGAVFPLACSWHDIGSWTSLWEVSDQDRHANVCRGNILTKEVHNSYLHSTHRLVAAVEVEDIIVVETADAVLVAPKKSAATVRTMVEDLRRRDREEAFLHRKVFRPWGSYECINSDARFQVKRITVKPGASLSLQMHHHRAEHWIVVKGTALIVNGDRELLLSENQSTYIPIGTKHRLENPGLIPLELIEVQSGTYLGEDDILRFDDNYGRALPQGENTPSVLEAESH